MTGIVAASRLAAWMVTGVSPFEQCSDRRCRKTVAARWIAMTLAREASPLSLPAIGRRFGNRDHTTVLHALRETRAWAERDPAFADLLLQARRALDVLQAPARISDAGTGGNGGS